MKYGEFQVDSLKYIPRISMEIIINCDNISKNFSGEEALKGLQYSIPQGALYGIIGPDGAGKTTMMQIFATLITPDTGDVQIKSRSIRTDFHLIRQILGYMPQRFSLYEDLSVMENLLFFARVFGISDKQRKERIQRLLTFSRLKPFVKRRVGKLSGGMKQKLALCCALIHTPEILILDEPTVGVDPVSREEFWDIIKELHAQGITIIISTPYMKEAAFCTELILLNKGSILLQGTPQNICREYPQNLYRIEDKTDLLACTTIPQLPEEIILLYPCKGELHLVSSLTENNINDIVRALKSVLPNLNKISRCQPTIEDIFMYWLEQSKS